MEKNTIELTLKEKVLLEAAIAHRIADINYDLKSEFLQPGVKAIFERDLSRYRKLQEKI